jgi:hypothetical protein
MFSSFIWNLFKTFFNYVHRKRDQLTNPLHPQPNLMSVEFYEPFFINGLLDTGAEGLGYIGFDTGPIAILIFEV